MSNRLTIYQGNTFPIEATISDQDSNLVDLTGLTVAITFYNRNTFVYTDSTTSHTDAANGVTSFTITKAETDTWPISLLRYEIEVTYLDGTKFTAVRNDVEVIADLD